MDLCEQFSKIPNNFNFAFDVVDRYAQLEPKKRALVWCNDESEENVFNFCELSQISNQTANFLISHNIQKGDRVMLMLRRRYEYWFFILALHKIGAIAVPAPEQLLQNDIEYRVNACGAKMLVASGSPELLSAVDGCLENTSSLKTLVTVQGKKDGWLSFGEEISKYDNNFERPSGKKATNNLDPMLIFFTSGTEGQPKMVVHNFLYPLAHIITAKQWQMVEDDGLHFTVAETGWAKNSWGKIYGQWICGSAVFVYDRKTFFPEKFLQKLEHYKVNTLCAPPTVYRYLVRQNFSKYNLSALKNAVTAGEALDAQLFEDFYNKTGLFLHEGYGQTETTLLAANFPGQKIKKGSLGKKSPQYSIDIIDENGHSCSSGQPGELVVKLDEGMPLGLFCGYFENGRLVTQVFKNGLYHTGDLVYKDEDEYIFFLGRTDDIIKSAGFRISPYEVEQVLLNHPKVKECAVAGKKDDERGQIVKAWIVLEDGVASSAELKQEIIAFSKKQTARYKCPREIEFVDSLPKTFNGKMKRKAIQNNE